MLGRREMSFLFLWILNPALILFYQNCSWDPPTRASAENRVQEEVSSQLPACVSQFKFNSNACIE